eukprot:Nk52_evm47s2118 gene=Nk52_evmTU47s2118
MAMQFKQCVRDVHVKPVTALAFNPFRREIFTGSEEGDIKVWEAESGKQVQMVKPHSGWTTVLIYCNELKLLFSASMDGAIMLWGSSLKLLQTINTHSPVYCLSWETKYQQLLVGSNGKVRSFLMKSDGTDITGGADILTRRPAVACEHSDIVRKIISCESRLYSAGNDKKIVIYDSHVYPEDRKLKVVAVISNAHDAAISCMVYGHDNDNSWIMTGSFDRVVKIWSLDGNLLQRIDGMNDTVTDLCYVPTTHTLWVTASSTQPSVYDPRTGANVSDFVGTFNHSGSESGAISFKKLTYIPEVNEVIGTTSRKHLYVWKYNPFAPVTTLHGHDDVVECLTYTPKVPVLIFSGAGDGRIIKWERLQLSSLMYSHESFRCSQEGKGGSSNQDDDSGMSTKTQQAIKSKNAARALKEKSSSDSQKMSSFDQDMQHKTTVLSVLYHEELDYLVVGSENRRIYVFGYDDKDMKTDGDEAAAMVKEDPELMNGLLGEESVTNRAAGLVCRFSLRDHKDCVTGLAAVSRMDLYNTHYLLSASWDRRICIWRLDDGRLHDVFRNSESGLLEADEIAADAIILGLDYCEDRDEFAYCCADAMVYIRKFAEKGRDMKLKAVLQGHEDEVCKVKWNSINKQWVTCSEDRTIRVWSADGLSCLSILRCQGPVTALCIDKTFGFVIGGSDYAIQVFDPLNEELVQTNVGHTDSVRDIIHIPERHQYVSASWDHTIRVWKAYSKKDKRAKHGSSGVSGQQDYKEEVKIPSITDHYPLVIPKALLKPPIQPMT